MQCQIMLQEMIDIIDDVTHEELMKANGSYKELMKANGSHEKLIEANGNQEELILNNWFD